MSYNHTIILCVLLCTSYAHNEVFDPAQYTKSAWQDVNQAVQPGQNDIITLKSSNKHRMPHSARSAGTATYCSFFKGQQTVHHPPADTLFVNNAALARQLDTFLITLDKTPNFMAYFTKIHLLILHEIYLYLTAIYTTFSMSHAQDVEQYLDWQERYALNEKTLVVFHLMSLLESQINQAMRTHLPGMPKNIASYAGPLLTKNDYGNDIRILIDNTENNIVQDSAAQAMIRAQRSTYLTLYGHYLSFFKNYTQYLTIRQNSYNSTMFIDYAQNIYSTINQYKKKLTATTLMPGLFFYEDQVLRSVEMITLLATRLPNNTKSVPWPACVVQNAINKTIARSNFNVTHVSNQCGNSSSVLADQGIPLGYPIAYLTENKKQLFINVPINSSSSSTKIYAQELRIQPDWLNSAQGIMSMLSACLGNFSALVSDIFAQESIVDPFLYCITANAARSVGIDALDNGSCSVVQSFIKGIQQASTESTQAIIPNSIPTIIMPPS